MAASMKQLEEMSEIDKMLDPCCAREVVDRRKALSLKQRLDKVDRSTARLRLRTEFWGTSTLQACPCADPTCGPASDYSLLAKLRDEKRGNTWSGGDGARSTASAYNAPTYEAREEGDDDDEEVSRSYREVGSIERFPGDGGFTDPEERGRSWRALIPDYLGAYVAPVTGGGGGGGEDEDEDEDEDDSDAELDAMMNDLGADGGAIARVAEERFAEAKQAVAMVEAARESGFGVHRALPHDDSSAVAYLQNCPRAVVHLVDPSALLCARVDLHLEGVASEHAGTAFVRFVAPRPSSDLLNFLGLHSGSIAGGALAAVKSGTSVAFAKLTQFGSNSSSSGSGGGSLVESALNEWLQHAGVLERQPQPHEWLEGDDGALGQSRLGLLGGASKDDDDEYYDCGRPGCRKSFRHDHVTAGLPAAFVAQSGEV